MMRISRVALVLALLVLPASAARQVLPGSRAEVGQPRGASGIDLPGMDRSVQPGDDFFDFANGSWIRSTSIPPDRSTYGIDAMLAEEALGRTRQILEAAAAGDAAPGSDQRKIGDYYASFLDEGAIQAKGLDPLKPFLSQIQAITDRRALAAWIGSSLRTDVDPLNATNLYTDRLFGLWIAQDFNEPTRDSAFLLQGGLGMPDRDYYLDPSPRMNDIRSKYQAYVAALLRTAGIAEPDSKAARIFELERKIAQAHWSRTESEDVLKANNPWKREEFARRAPGLDWSAFFKAAGLDAQPVIVVWQPSAVSGISALVASEPLETWKDYLTYQVVNHNASHLPRAFVDQRFGFYGKVLSGTPELRERWKRAVADTDAAMGEAVGRLYVERYFPPAAKAKAEALVRELVAAFGQRIDRLAWMSPQTKEKAKAKLATLKVFVGYPEKWRDYSKLAVIRGEALMNAWRAEEFECQRNLRKLREPVDRSEWVMTPQTVNAVNLPVQNALNFPAAILQPPYFDPTADAAANFGAIGAVIGHEISHSFDDQGSQFDAAGRLRNWWTPEDFTHFKAAAARLVSQYDAYRPFPDATVNGRQTLSENIADVAGLATAYDAYKLSLGGKPAPVLEGLTGDQRFFLAFAQSWREKLREAALRQQLLTDGHAPAEYRADAVRNVDAWYEAFAVKPGQRLHLEPADRVRIW